MTTMKRLIIIVIVLAGILAATAFTLEGIGSTNSVSSATTERDVLKQLICETRVANVAKCEAILEKLHQKDLKTAKQLLAHWMESDVRMIRLDTQCPISDDGKKAVERAERYLSNNKLLR